MKLSARNQIKGKIIEVKKGATTAHVRVEIAPGQVITSSITNEAVDELGLKVGDTAIVVIKASDVMIGAELGNRHDPRCPLYCRHAVGCGAGIGAGTRRLRQVQMAARPRARAPGVAIATVVGRRHGAAAGGSGDARAGAVGRREVAGRALARAEIS